MIKTKWRKTDHQLFINIVLTAMVIYSNVTDAKREWTALIILTAFVVMLAHPKDFITPDVNDATIAS